MRSHADWPDSGTASAVRDAKSLVQIQMTNVGAIITGAAKPHLRVHVGAIQINLPAVSVHNFADLADGRLEYTVGARVRDHERTKVAGVFARFGAQISQINVAIF